MQNTLRIWSPSSSPSLAAGLSSKTPATKIPTSFPPANRRPTLSPFLNLTSFILGLQEKTGGQMKSGKKVSGNIWKQSLSGTQNTPCYSNKLCVVKKKLKLARISEYSLRTLSKCTIYIHPIYMQQYRYINVCMYVCMCTIVFWIKAFGHLPENAVVMTSAGYRSIRGADREVHIRLTRLCINWLWFYHKYKHSK